MRAPDAAPERPNILLILAEDMSPRAGAFGDPVAVTPTIDRLAREGVRYPNTFTASGVCAPSRAALMTGVHQIALGAHNMRTSDRDYATVPPPEIKAFPELLRAAGYYTYTDYKLDYQFSGFRAGSGPFTIWNDEGFRASWRNRKPGQPFFGLVNLFVTHESALYPRTGWPKSLAHLGTQVFYFFKFFGHEDVVEPEAVSVPPYYPDTPLVRKDLARHYNNIHHMDEMLGGILAELDEDGLANSTVVIWSTDHGDGLPRAKREVYDSGIRVPLIIRWPSGMWPDALEPGATDEGLVSFVDLAPTLLSIAGIEMPEFMQGRVFTGNAMTPPRAYVYAAKDRMSDVAIPDRQRAVRDARYKYIRNYRPERPGAVRLRWRDWQDISSELWSLHETGSLQGATALWFQAPRPPEELYDTVEDPHEVRDLADDSSHAETLERMRQALDRWLERTGDLGVVPEDELKERMWPGGDQPVTAAPEIAFEASDVGLRMWLSCATHGASIAYRPEGRNADWEIYSSPIAVHLGDMVEARAVRYGFRASEVVRATAFHYDSEGKTGSVQEMALIVALLGALLTLLGVFGLISPRGLMLYLSSWQSERRIHLALAIRLVFGVVLIMAAPSCRFSEAVRILGIIAIVAAVVGVFMGTERMRALIEWWKNQSPAFIRVWLVFVVAFGVFLVYAGL
jgi:arylsulfatase A-like enzyme